MIGAKNVQMCGSSLGDMSLATTVSKYVSRTTAHSIICTHSKGLSLCIRQLLLPAMLPNPVHTFANQFYKQHSVLFFSRAQSHRYKSLWLYKTTDLRSHAAIFSGNSLLLFTLPPPSPFTHLQTELTINGIIIVIQHLLLIYKKMAAVRFPALYGTLSGPLISRKIGPGVACLEF